jgi:flagellar basal-body rod modification protein FlgD
MQVTSASTSAASNLASTTSDTTANPSSVLSQADFLKLLVAQMQNQDPMNPQSDTEMASQMAQFSSLTATTASSTSLSMMQANSLIGQTVNLQVDSQTTASGVVQGVIMSNGTPQILVNGSDYTLSQVTGIAPTVTPTTSSSNTQN